MHSGPLQDALRKYKYENRTGWARIFGRVLAGYLERYEEWTSRFDVIAANPTFLGDSRQWDHIGAIIERADVEALGRWTFDLATPRLIVKTAETSRMVRL